MSSSISIAAYASCAGLISITDIRYGLIRNKHLFLFATITLICNLRYLDVTSLKNLLVVTGLLVIMLVLFNQAIGAGDLKLFWVISLWCHSLTIWLQLFSFAWVLGGIFSVTSAAFFRSSKGNIPLAPFIFLAFIPAIAS